MIALSNEQVLVSGGLRKIGSSIAEVTNLASPAPGSPEVLVPHAELYVHHPSDVCIEATAQFCLDVSASLAPGAAGGLNGANAAGTGAAGFTDPNAAAQPGTDPNAGAQQPAVPTP